MTAAVFVVIAAKEQLSVKGNSTRKRTSPIELESRQHRDDYLEANRSSVPPIDSFAYIGPSSCSLIKFPRISCFYCKPSSRHCLTAIACGAILSASFYRFSLSQTVCYSLQCCSLVYSEIFIIQHPLYGQQHVTIWLALSGTADKLIILLLFSDARMIRSMNTFQFLARKLYTMSYGHLRDSIRIWQNVDLIGRFLYFVSARLTLSP